MPNTPRTILIVLFDLAGSESESACASGTLLDQFTPLLDCAFDQFAADSALVNQLDLALLGCYRFEEKCYTFRMAKLPPEAPRSTVLPLSEYRRWHGPMSDENPMSWLQAITPRGTSALSEALVVVYRLVQEWRMANPDGTCQVLVVTENPTAELQPLMESIAAIGGKTQADVCQFAQRPDEVFIPEWHLRLCRKLRKHPAQAPLNCAAFTLLRSFSAPRLGNDPEQWEDAWAIDLARGRVAICDGAGEGIFCKQWARRLAEAAVQTTEPPTEVHEWAAQLVPDWLSEIGYAQLRWTAQSKVDSLGAASTFLALSFGSLSNGRRRWSAVAVGDACLVVVSQGRWRLSFPVVAASQLGSAPDLVRTKASGPGRVAQAAGYCLPGDRFFLATDAVAAWLFQLQHVDGALDRLAQLSVDEWLREIEDLRQTGQVPNDDCTLLILEVSANEPEPQAESQLL